MGRKKRKAGEDENARSSYCVYCDKTFQDDKVLDGHQRAKHFKCTVCPKQKIFSNAEGIVIHMYNAHRQTMTTMPNSKSGREQISQSVLNNIEVAVDGDYKRQKLDLPPDSRNAQFNQPTYGFHLPPQQAFPTGPYGANGGVGPINMNSGPPQHSSPYHQHNNDPMGTMHHHSNTNYSPMMAGSPLSSAAPSYSVTVSEPYQPPGGDSPYEPDYGTDDSTPIAPPQQQPSQQERREYPPHVSNHQSHASPYVDGFRPPNPSHLNSNSNNHNDQNHAGPYNQSYPPAQSSQYGGSSYTQMPHSSYQSNDRPQYLYDTNSEFSSSNTYQQPQHSNTRAPVYEQDGNQQMRLIYEDDEVSMEERRARLDKYRVQLPSGEKYQM